MDRPLVHRPRGDGYRVAVDFAKAEQGVWLLPFVAVKIKQVFVDAPRLSQCLNLSLTRRSQLLSQRFFG